MEIQLWRMRQIRQSTTVRVGHREDDICDEREVGMLQHLQTSAILAYKVDIA